MTGIKCSSSSPPVPMRCPLPNISTPLPPHFTSASRVLHGPQLKLLPRKRKLTHNKNAEPTKPKASYFRPTPACKQAASVILPSARSMALTVGADSAIRAGMLPRGRSLAGQEPWPASQEIHLGNKTQRDLGKPRSVVPNGQHGHRHSGRQPIDSSQQPSPPAMPARDSSQIWAASRHCASPRPGPLGGLEDSFTIGAQSPCCTDAQVLLLGTENTRMGSGGDTVVHNEELSQRPLLTAPGCQSSHWLNTGTGMTPNTSWNKNNCPVNP